MPCPAEDQAAARKAGQGISTPLDLTSQESDSLQRMKELLRFKMIRVHFI